jgi:hypothetical protein
MAGVVHIPWYATAFRADRLEEAIAEIAPLATRYGATAFQVFRFRDDRYKFLQTATFESKIDWETYWAGPDFTRWRSIHNGWYQVPIIYQWSDVVVEGRINGEPVLAGSTAPPEADVSDPETV